MTKEEFKKVVGIMTGADAGCQYCSRSLINELLDHYPQWKAEAEEIYKGAFYGSYSLDDED